MNIGDKIQVQMLNDDYLECTITKITDYSIETDNVCILTKVNPQDPFDNTLSEITASSWGK